MELQTGYTRSEGPLEATLGSNLIVLLQKTERDRRGMIGNFGRISKTYGRHPSWERDRSRLVGNTVGTRRGRHTQPFPEYEPMAAWILQQT